MAERWSTVTMNCRWSTASDDELEIDLEPFERLRDAPMGMVAHCLYTAWDAKHPASQSQIVIHDIIRGRIGFDGFLMSDDIDMEALAGSTRANAPRPASRPAATWRCLAMAYSPTISTSPTRYRRTAPERLRSDWRRAMAMTFTPNDEMDFAEAVAKRDALAGARLTKRIASESMEEELFDQPRRATMRRSTLSLDGWEGPLDLLLTLARAQKVDLTQISILALTEQYLAYIDERAALRLEIAADYLVMAAWLAYLKSCLLLPKDPEADPSPEELALRLQLRLQRLDAMREAGARLIGRDRLGRDVFARGRAGGAAGQSENRCGRPTASISTPLMAGFVRAPSRQCTSSPIAR